MYNDPDKFYADGAWLEEREEWLTNGNCDSIRYVPDGGWAEPITPEW